MLAIALDCGLSGLSPIGRILVQVQWEEQESISHKPQGKAHCKTMALHGSPAHLRADYKSQGNDVKGWCPARSCHPLLSTPPGVHLLCHLLSVSFRQVTNLFESQLSHRKMRKTPPFLLQTSVSAPSPAKIGHMSLAPPCLCS